MNKIANLEDNKGGHWIPETMSRHSAGSGRFIATQRVRKQLGQQINIDTIDTENN